VWISIWTRPNAAAKLRAYRVGTIIAGVIFAGFAVWMVPPAVVLMFPAVAVITWINLRNTIFCNNCGGMVTGQVFQRSAFCPRCGVPLNK
jgi:hypothetical protein